MPTATTAVHRAEATTTPADTADANLTNAGNDSGSAVLLAEPEALGLCDGSIAELAILLTKADEQDRTASRQIEDAADSAATKDENDRVAQMRAKADADESQAWAKGVGEMVGGAFSIVGGAIGPCTSIGADGSPHTTYWNQIGDGASKASASLGEIFAGQYHGDADRDDAGAAKADAQAQAEIRTFNRAHDGELAANASMQKVDQFLDQVQQTRNATLLTAATFRA